VICGHLTTCHYCCDVGSLPAASGEELFGLTITQYPELEKTEKEIIMLERLYGRGLHSFTFQLKVSTCC
jgi:hypothetical protein